MGPSPGPPLGPPAAAENGRRRAPRAPPGARPGREHARPERGAASRPCSLAAAARAARCLRRRCPLSMASVHSGRLAKLLAMRSRGQGAALHVQGRQRTRGCESYALSRTWVPPPPPHGTSQTATGVRLSLLPPQAMARARIQKRRASKSNRWTRFAEPRRAARAPQGAGGAGRAAAGEATQAVAARGRWRFLAAPKRGACKPFRVGGPGVGGRVQQLRAGGGGGVACAPTGWEGRAREWRPRPATGSAARFAPGGGANGSRANAAWRCQGGRCAHCVRPRARSLQWTAAGLGTARSG